MNKKISLWNEFEFLVLSTHHVHSSELLGRKYLKIL